MNRLQTSSLVRSFAVTSAALGLFIPCLPLGADTGTATYTYDELGRLRTGDFSDGRTVDYQYDAAGNRTATASGFPPELTIANASSGVNEGGTLLFPVTRTGDSAQNITVDCATQNGTAVGGQAAPLDDFVVVTNQQLVFLPSEPSPTTKNCSVVTKTDSYYEGTQSVTATLQNSVGAVIATGSATGEIYDTNNGPVFTVASAANTEGSAIAFTIAKSGLTELSHSVSYTTSDSSATVADSDYTAVGTTAVAFSSTQTTATVQVSTTQDAKYENSDAFLLALSSPTMGAMLGSPASAAGTINNDDAPPSFSINDPTALNEGSSLTFTVSNVGNTNTALSHSVSWSTANNTATSGTDYTANSGTLTFTSGQASQTVTVATLTDGTYDGGNETFFVNLATNGSSNGATISDAQGIGTIADVDSSTPSTPTLSGGGGTGSSYSMSWTASTGPISYYVLEENYNGTGYSAYPNIAHPTLSKSFSNKTDGDYVYRVKACSAAGVCSAYSNLRAKQVCSSACQ